MSCLNNVYVTLNAGEDNERVVRVRCRHCEDCKQSARSSAVVRMHYEDIKCQRAGGMIFFFTLTFADAYVPFKFHRMCFDKKLIQDWLQKFRQVLRRHYGYRLKVFIASELGHVGTERPHHHGKLYLYPDTKYQLKSWKEGGKHFAEIPKFPITYAAFIRNCWMYGFSDVQVFDPNKGGNDYCAKYVSKDTKEENLFKDIITRIQMKRGKGSQDHSKVLKYYQSTFPSLFAFTQRYCPFTMISQGLGDNFEPSYQDLVECKPVEIDGFPYSMPRYYSDRYIRKEQKVHQEFVVHKPDLSDCGERPNYVVIRRDVSYYDVRKHSLSFHNELHPFYIDYSNVKPSETILSKYLRVSHDNLFGGSISYAPMPFYKTCFSYSGKSYLRQVVPKQSEVSSLTRERAAFLNSLSNIEDLYFSLPDLLRNSCNYDVPKILADAPKISSSDEVLCWTREGSILIQELQELSQVASEWRARSRIARREQSRLEKMRMNKVYARKKLTWNEYKSKSHYFNLINKI